jgi:hypothetical protein
MGMMPRMFFALFSAGFANLGTEHHEIAGKFRATGIQATTQGTNISTVAAKLYTGSHVVAFAIAIAHFQASGYAAFAGFGAFKTGVGVAVVVLHSFHIRCRFVDHYWSDKVTTLTR